MKRKIALITGLIFGIFYLHGQNAGNALSFDGNAGYVNIGTISPPGNFSKGFTFEAWANWIGFKILVKVD